MARHRARPQGGHRARMLGAAHERLVLCCFEPVWVTPPGWLDCLRQATNEEDGNGIDIVAVTDVGEIPFQVKSGWYRAHFHEQRYPDIPVFVVRVGQSENHVRRRLVNKLADLRKLLIAKQELGIDKLQKGTA